MSFSNLLKGPFDLPAFLAWLQSLLYEEVEPRWVVPGAQKISLEGWSCSVDSFMYLYSP